MPLRSGRKYLNQIFPQEQQPFKLILVPEKVPQKKIYDFSLDFDNSSKQWRKNKIHIGEGYFIYKRYSERIFNAGF
jgi:hypothetical protein